MFCRPRCSKERSPSLFSPNLAMTLSPSGPFFSSSSDLNQTLVETHQCLFLISPRSILRRFFERLPTVSLDASVRLSREFSPVPYIQLQTPLFCRHKEREEIKKRLVVPAMIASPVSKLLEKLRFYPIRSAVAATRAPFRSFSSTETRDLAGDTRTLDIDRRTDVSPAPRRRRRRRRGGDLFPSFFSGTLSSSSFPWID